MKIKCVFTNASGATNNKHQFGGRRSALGTILQLRALAFNNFLVHSLLRFRQHSPFGSRSREGNSVTEFSKEEKWTLRNTVTVALGEG